MVAVAVAVAVPVPVGVDVGVLVAVAVVVAVVVTVAVGVAVAVVVTVLVGVAVAVVVTMAVGVAVAVVVTVPVGVAVAVDVASACATTSGPGAADATSANRPSNSPMAVAVPSKSLNRLTCPLASSPGFVNATLDATCYVKAEQTGKAGRGRDITRRAPLYTLVA